MPTISVSVDENIKKRMSKLDEVNWSAVARKAFEDKIKEIELMKKIANKSKLTEKDAKEISDKMNREISKKFRSL